MTDKIIIHGNNLNTLQSKLGQLFEFSKSAGIKFNEIK